MSTRELSAPEAIRLVAGREIGAKLRSRAFLLITVVLVAVVTGIVLLFHFLDRNGMPTRPTKVGVTAAAAAFEQPLRDLGHASGLRVQTTVVDRSVGERQVRDGRLAALLAAGPQGALKVVVQQSVSPALLADVRMLAQQDTVNRQVAALGADGQAVQRALTGAALNVEVVQASDQHRAARVGVASVVGVLTYIMLLISIQLTGQGVVEEKANRIVELLLATIRPWELLAGKVLGIGLATMAQVAVLGVAGGGMAIATGVLHLSAAVLSGVIAWALVWYVLGYFLYALVIAAAASLVSRQEDLAAVAAPVSVLVIGAYLVGQIVVPSNPNGTAAVVMSEIPLLSPVVMPMRSVYGVPGWQTALALASTVLTLCVTARLAGAVYRHAILLTGRRVKLRVALRPALAGGRARPATTQTEPRLSGQAAAVPMEV